MKQSIKKTKKVDEPEITYIRNTQALKQLKLKAQFNKNVDVFLGEKMNDVVTQGFFGRKIRNDNGSILLHYKREKTLSQILRDIGIAESISQANGAGWNYKPNTGFTDLYLDGLKKWKGEGFGKRPHRITIYSEFK